MVYKTCCRRRKKIWRENSWKVKDTWLMYTIQYGKQNANSKQIFYINNMNYLLAIHFDTVS